MGTSITISTFSNLLLDEITRISSKNTNSLTPIIYSKLMVKYIGTALFLLIFLALQDLFNPYRNDLCDTYLNSLLDSRNHSLEIIKKLLLTILCFYIAGYLAKQMKVAYDNGYSLLRSLFVDLFNAEVDIKICIPCFKRNHKMDTREFRIYKKLKMLLIILYFTITSIKLIFINYINLIHLWSGTFLLINLLVLSIILLLQYFPYQIFISLNSYLHYQQISTNERGNSKINNSNIYRLKTNSSEIATVIENNNRQDIIDNAFIECKLELRDKYMQNTEYKEGQNQPNMKNAYKILFLYTIFTVLSVLTSFLFNHLESTVKISPTRLFLVIMLIVLFILSKIILILIIYYQPRETQYVSNLRQKILFIPFLQLITSFLNIYFFFKLSSLALTTLLIELLIIMFCLFLFMNVIRLINRKALIIATDMLVVANEMENQACQNEDNSLKPTTSNIELIDNDV